MVSYKTNVWYNLSCLNKLTKLGLSTNKILLIIWQFSGTCGITRYHNGWRKDVINQCLEFGLKQPGRQEWHSAGLTASGSLSPAHTPSIAFVSTAAWSLGPAACRAMYTGRTAGGPRLKRRCVQHGEAGTHVCVKPVLLSSTDETHKNSI